MLMLLQSGAGHGPLKNEPVLAALHMQIASGGAQTPDLGKWDCNKNTNSGSLGNKHSEGKANIKKERKKERNKARKKEIKKYVPSCCSFLPVFLPSLLPSFLPFF